MKVLHVSAECYPAAKVGGLADVVGALPKYMIQNGVESEVIIPKYDLPWINKQKFKKVYEADYWYPSETVKFKILKLVDKEFPFPLYFVDIPGAFDQGGVYANHDGYYFENEAERLCAFQRSTLEWVKSRKRKPDIIHCHDHHTGLIPFMMENCLDFDELSKIPSVFTIHNERYQGAFDWTKQYLLPAFDTRKSGLLDWASKINPLASAIRCAWKFTTVSPSYMEELKHNSYGLEWLFWEESDKSQGILNGIDTKVWDPKSDPYLEIPMKRSLEVFKRKNKAWLCEEFDLDPSKPILGFIGRFAYEKGADLLPGIASYLMEAHMPANLIILGTGDKGIEWSLDNFNHINVPCYKAIIDYNEGLAHKIYAGSDFLLMPSRVEPCGLNQMYAMRYGTVPIVRSIGGLKDSVRPASKSDGTGFLFEHLNLQEIINSLHQALNFYGQNTIFKALRERCYLQDFSWETSVKKYIKLYNELAKKAK